MTTPPSPDEIRHQPVVSDDHTWAKYAAIVVAVVATLPLLLGIGFLNTRGGGDSPFLLFRLQQLMVALGDGHFPVRWMPDAAFGLGYPFYHFYAALPFYFAALFKALGFSYVFSLKLTHLLGFAVAAWGTWGWLKATGRSAPAAWLGAVAYTFAPFHMVNVYVRGDSIAEFGAMAIFPLCLWAVVRLRQQPSPARAAQLALCYAALILSHNISALIFSPFLLGYLAYQLIPEFLPPNASLEKRTSSARTRELFAANTLLGLLLAFGLAAFFFLPTLAEQGIAQLETVTTGYFNYTEHFRSTDLVQQQVIFNYDVGSPESSPFTMGLVQAAFALLGVLAMVLTRDRHALFVLLGVAVSTVMITPYSELLWENLPLLSLTQFPWRFLSIQALFAAAATAELIGKREEAYNWLMALVLVLALGAAAMFGLRLDFTPIADAEVTTERLQTYEYFTGNIGTTIRYEYLPVWTQPRPYTSGEFVSGQADALIVEGTGSGQLLEKRTQRQHWQIDVFSDRAVVAVPLLYWPGWQATANGRPLPIGPLTDLGWTTFELPEGRHDLTFSLTLTPLRLAAAIASAVALLLVVVFLVPWVALPQTLRNANWADGLRKAAIGLVVLVAIALIGRWVTSSIQPQGAATMDFAQYGYLHSDKVPFASGNTLLDYGYSSEILPPGATLTVVSNWQGPPGDYTLTLIGPGSNFFAADVPFAAAEGQIGPQSSAALIIPDYAPPGVYFLTLNLASGDPALTTTGQTRASLYLQPLRVLTTLNPPATTPKPLSEGVAIAGVRVIQPADDQLIVIPTWQLSRPLPINLAIGLRLYDEFGVELAAYDGPAGNGLHPTYLWPVGQPIPDPYRLAVPPGLAPGGYELQVTLYNATTIAPLVSTLEPIALTRWSSRGSAPLTEVIPGLALSAFAPPAIVQAGQSLLLQPTWATIGPQPIDRPLQVRWLITSSPNPTSDPNQAAAVVTLPLRADQWPVDALVRAPAAINIPPELTTGPYTLQVAVLDAAGRPVAPALTLGTLQVDGIPGLGAPVPTISNPLDVYFDDGSIHLVGYDIGISGRTLNLRLFFKAEGIPDRDLRYFVHVYEPFSEEILAQHDATPQGGVLPTSRWLPNMVITESIQLDLSSLVAGQAYNIGLGWYDELSGARVLAANAEGIQLQANRAVLDFAVLFER